MKHHIDWPKDKESWPVFIDVGHSVEQILDKDFITASIKESTTNTLGFMLDADGDAAARYSSFRHHAVPFFPKMPRDLPPSGLIADNDDGKRLGLWIMPDNASKGALELFLRFLVPDDSSALWQHSVKSVSEARQLGSKCRDCHVDKANLYTWLAWQDEPGQTPGLALTRKILDPNSTYATPFIKWFLELYCLQPSLALSPTS